MIIYKNMIIIYFLVYLKFLMTIVNIEFMFKCNNFG